MFYCFSLKCITDHECFFFLLFLLQFVTSRGKSLVERVVKEQVCLVSTNEFTWEL